MPSSGASDFISCNAGMILPVRLPRLPIGMRIIYRTARVQLPASLACVTHFIRGPSGIMVKVHQNFTDIAYRFQRGTGDSSLPLVVPSAPIETINLGVHTLSKKRTIRMMLGT
ncbi:hypothetical protein BDQ94DRAFT_137154 [Aspergillus welwitschiae]|uniref:Uncharacterized protein n=1 Tax=Aspergillus welwitschiae TaxID=1341132 RepID=A0A3F3QCF4_9EURO|nr:hypothetical protein BDQ94DRAFT_137154 [Aspergillus welwitschiae]RDH36934.1 hypothetical protein BDQ94DRAFT_137154 [Aspergillus welwitschiae]